MKNTDAPSVANAHEKGQMQGVAAVAPGSASGIIIAELSGKPIRPLNRERMLQTGDKLCNRYGQELWTVEAFHPKGARVTQWPHGGVADYTWENLYAFYERVPPNDPALQNAEISNAGTKKD